MQSFEHWLDYLLNPETLPGALIYGVIVAALALLIGRAVHLAVNRRLDLAQAQGADPTGIRFLGKLCKLIVYIIAFVCYSHLIPHLQKLGTAWLASVGVISVVVGLAAQSTLSNLVSGIALVLYRPFRIGDRVQVTAPTGTEVGVVESIDLGYTTLRTRDARRLVIPNATIASQMSINLSLSDSNTPCGVALKVAEGTDIARARNIFLDVAKAVPKIAKVEGCFVTRVTNRGTVLTLSAVCSDPDDVAQIRSDLLENTKKQFDAAGVKVA
jgi:small-conductance mechanosensitive channel